MATQEKQTTGNIKAPELAASKKCSWEVCGTAPCETKEVAMRVKFYLLLILTSLISTTAYAQTVNVNYDKNTIFSSYKTYSWGKGTPAVDPKLNLYIIAGIEAQLAAKGWQKVESDSDALVIYNARSTTETQTDPYAPGGPYSGYVWSWRAAAAFDDAGCKLFPLVN